MSNEDERPRDRADHFVEEAVADHVDFDSDPGRASGRVLCDRGCPPDADSAKPPDRAALDVGPGLERGEVVAPDEILSGFVHGVYVKR